MRFIATTLLLLIIPFAAFSQAETYLPEETGAVWEYSITFDDQELLPEEIRRTDTLSEIRSNNASRTYTIDTTPTGSYQWVAGNQTMYAPIHVMALPDKLMQLLPDWLMDESLLPLFRFNAPTDVTGEVFSGTAKTEVPDVITDLLEFPNSPDSVEVTIHIDSKRIGREQVDLPVGTYQTQVFENRISMRIKVEAGLLHTTVTFLDDYTVTSYWAENTGLVLQKADSLNLLDNLPSGFIPENTSAEIPAFRSEMTHFQPHSETTPTESTEREARQTETPAGLTVHPNYPNPFNPVTTLSFQNGEPGAVSISVYDIQGREVQAVVTDEYISAGTHTFEVNGSDWPSGNYLYRVHFTPESNPSQTITRTRTMTLIK